MELNFLGSIPKVETPSKPVAPAPASGAAPAPAQNEAESAAPVEAPVAPSGEENTSEADVTRLEQMVEAISDLLQNLNSHLSIRLHEESKRYQALVVDNQTAEVLKSIPVEELLEMYGRIRTAVGAFLDVKV